ncbi:MAG: archease [Candidatus Omnitrophota bacterium]
MKTFEILEHTADLKVRVRGNGLDDLFKNAGLAIFQISAERQITKDKKKHKFSISQNAQNLEELFVNWLNELLSLSAAKEVIFEDIKINKLNEKELEAAAAGSDIINFKVNTEIKAATYHELKIEKIDYRWQAEVIFDV